jgi:folate-dependent phosphoribosylglycinamide formyltransferase PurN
VAGSTCDSHSRTTGYAAL